MHLAPLHLPYISDPPLAVSNATSFSVQNRISIGDLRVSRSWGHNREKAAARRYVLPSNTLQSHNVSMLRMILSTSNKLLGCMTASSAREADYC